MRRFVACDGSESLRRRATADAPAAAAHARNLDGSEMEHRDADGDVAIDEGFDDVKVIGFYSSPEPKCYVCSHVFADERPVLYMCREAGDQILACGGDDHAQITDSWRVVHLNHLLERDADLQVISDLTNGRPS